MGIGFAIPADSAIKVMQDLINYGQVIRGWLGIEAQQMTPELAQSFQLSSPQGVIITAIYNNGPAHKAGLRPGDIILRMNDITVSDGRLSMLQVAQGRPGERIEIEVLRNAGHLGGRVGSRPVVESFARGGELSSPLPTTVPTRKQHYVRADTETEAVSL